MRCSSCFRRWKPAPERRRSGMVGLSLTLGRHREPNGVGGRYVARPLIAPRSLAEMQVAAAAFAAAVATIATAGDAAASASDRTLLERHRPLLVYDRSERRRAVAVEPLVREGLPPRLSDKPTAPDARAVAYGRVVRDAGRVYLQYWLFSTYNSHDRGILRTGRHEGDWELVQLSLGADGEPVTGTLTQHSAAERCSWQQLERDASAPRIYVANGSHALYPRRGVHDRPFPDPNDEARGGGPTTRPELRRIHDDRPAWIRWQGRWGASRAGIVPAEQPSPRGPAFQGLRWSDPAGFEAGARACGTPAPGLRWLVPALIAFACLGLGWFALRRRRTRLAPDR